MMSNLLKLLLPVVLAFLPVAIGSPNCYADPTTEFVPADERSASQGILGYVVVDPGDDTGTIYVLASTLFSSIERSAYSGCVSVFSATSAVSGEQLTMSIDPSGTASFTQDGGTVATILFDYNGGYSYSGSPELDESLVYKALLAATMDANLALIKPCQGQVAFNIPLNQTFQRDNGLWSVASATIGRTPTNSSFVTFSAHSGQNVENWSVNISTGTSVVQTVTVNGQMQFSIQRTGDEISITTPSGTATGNMSQGTPPASVQALLQVAGSNIGFGTDVMQATSTASGPTQQEVEEECRQMCNNDFPYGSNCQTITEKYDCCLTDVQRAACRRGCVCEYFEPIYGHLWGFWCGAKAGTLYDIDVAACAAAFLRSWKVN